MSQEKRYEFLLLYKCFKKYAQKDVALLTYHIIGKTFKNFIADAQKITNFLRLIFTCFLTVAKSIFAVIVQINFSRMNI